MIALTRLLVVPKVDLVEVVVVEWQEEATVVEAARNATSVVKSATSLVTVLKEEEAVVMVVVEEDTRVEVVGTVEATVEAAVGAVGVGVKPATLVAATAICRETAPKVKNATTVSFSSGYFLPRQLTFSRWRGRSSES